MREPNSVQMIDVCAAKLSDYSYPITKSSNWTAVIGYNYAANRCTQNQSRARHFVIDKIIQNTAVYTPFVVEKILIVMIKSRIHNHVAHYLDRRVKTGLNIVLCTIQTIDNDLQKRKINS